MLGYETLGLVCTGSSVRNQPNVRFGLRVIEAAGEAEIRQTRRWEGESGLAAGAPKRAPALPASGGLQYRAGRRTHARSRLIEHRHVFRADAAQAGPADTAKLAISRAVPTTGITTTAEGTFGHGPVMILAAVPAVSTDRHTHMPRSPRYQSSMSNKSSATFCRSASVSRHLPSWFSSTCKMRCSSVLGLCISSGW